MIDKAILKKHNLKAVPFSCIGEGQTFYSEETLEGWPDEFVYFNRRLQGGDIVYADGAPSITNVEDFLGDTVYVPVWRPTNV